MMNLVFIIQHLFSKWVHKNGNGVGYSYIRYACDAYTYRGTVYSTPDSVISVYMHMCRFSKSLARANETITNYIFKLLLFYLLNHMPQLFVHDTRRHPHIALFFDFFPHPEIQ